MLTRSYKIQHLVTINDDDDDDVQSRHYRRMKSGWKTRLCLSLTLCLPAFGRDHFDEQLTIKPLRDGKVASRFSFKTVLQDASPRNPQTLGVDDTCAFFEYILHQRSSSLSPALHHLPTGFRADPARVRRHRATPNTQRRELELRPVGVPRRARRRHRRRAVGVDGRRGARQVRLAQAAFCTRLIR